MANVYSTLLLSQILTAGHVYTVPVPTGKTMTVRDIVAHNNNGLGLMSQGVEVYDVNNVVIAEWLPPDSLMNRTHHWEGHQVLEVGDQLQVVGIDSGWRIRISGYLLTLP